LVTRTTNIPKKCGLRPNPNGAVIMQCWISRPIGKGKGRRKGKAEKKRKSK